MLSYTWRIPSIDQERDLLCSGYARLNYRRQYVTTSIVNLFAEYYSPKPYTLNLIKNAKCEQSFQSPIFDLKSLKFYLDLFPNGCDEDSEGQISLFVTLLSLPPKISKIRTKIRLSLVETNTSYVHDHIFEADELDFGWPSNAILLSQIQDLRHITFVFKLNIKSYWNINLGANAWYNNQKNNEIPITKHRWDISDKKTIHQIKTTTKPAESWIFPVGKLRFFAQLQPEKEPISNPNISLFLSLYCLPNRVQKILARYTFLVNETNTFFTECVIFDRDNMNNGWDNGTLTLSEILHFPSLAIFIDITIVEIYDIYGNIMNIRNFIGNTQSSNIVNCISAEKYIWRITDKNIIDQWKEDYSAMWKNSKTGNDMGIESAIFTIGSFKWKLKFIRNNMNLILYLALTKLPSKIQQIDIQFELYCVEARKKRRIRCATFDRKHLSQGWSRGTLQCWDIQKFNTLTFEVDIVIINNIQIM